jgi:hypothetical protein
MTKLIIKQRGLFISIPGIASFRTPAEVDISNVNLKLVVAELHKIGIREYEIKSKDITSLKNKITSLLSNKEITIIDEKDGIIIDTKNEEILNIVKNQAEAMKNIEGLLSNLLNSGSKEFVKESVKESKKIKKVEEVEEFIPSININKSKIKGISTSSVKTKSDFKKDAENLTKIDKNEKE